MPPADFSSAEPVVRSARRKKESALSEHSLFSDKYGLFVGKYRGILQPRGAQPRDLSKAIHALAKQSQRKPREGLFLLEWAIAPHMGRKPPIGAGIKPESPRNSKDPRDKQPQNTDKHQENTDKNPEKHRRTGKKHR